MPASYDRSAVGYVHGYKVRLLPRKDLYLVALQRDETGALEQLMRFQDFPEACESFIQYLKMTEEELDFIYAG